MFPRIILRAASLAAAATAAFPCAAATLPHDASLHLKPDARAAVVATLPAGSSVTAMIKDELAAEGIGPLPTGWVAVRHAGPVYGYALNTDVGKNLALKPGAIVRVAPSPDGTIISMVGEGDQAEVVEVIGDWSKVVFGKSLILFLNPVPPAPQPPPPRPATTAPAGSAAASAPVPAPAPAPAGAASGTPAMAPGPAAPAPPSPAPAVSTAAQATPRVFQGYLMRTRRILGAGPRLDYQLVDENGRRIALLDLSALLLTDPLDRFEERMISVFGPATRPPESKDIVIRVETLQLVR